MFTGGSRLVESLGDDAAKVESVVASVSKGVEVEARLKEYKCLRFNVVTHKTLLKFAKSVGPLKSSVYVDANCSDGGVTVRVSIPESKIGKYVGRSDDYDSPSMVYRLVYVSGRGDEGVTFMKKKRINVVLLADVAIRMSSSSEEKFDGAEEPPQGSVIFRLKGRTSVDFKHAGVKMRIDLTVVKEGKTLHGIASAPSKYEVEVEILDETMKKGAMMALMDVCETLRRVIQGTSLPLSEPTIASVIDAYETSMGGNLSQTLKVRKVSSLEIRDAVDTLPDNYAVLDKADGERCVVMIHDGRAYLVFNSLFVRDIGVETPPECDGSLLDAEYVFIPSAKRHLVLVFDCISDTYENSYLARLASAAQVVASCFVSKKQKGFINKEVDYTRYNTVDKLVERHGRELQRYHEALSHDMKVDVGTPLVRVKYVVPAAGIAPWEIFSYSVMYWESYKKGYGAVFQYPLDGLVFHPLRQNYATSASDSKYLEYKWKPQGLNSIDFYVTFKKDENGGQANFYDNTEDGGGKYKICELFVGKRQDGVEGPVRFSHGGGEAYLPTCADDTARDASGKAIYDKTVVEFAYTRDEQINPVQRRWVPLRTRHDKTEFVSRYGRRYGNYVTVADRVWASMRDPLLMSDFMELAMGSSGGKSHYHTKRAALASKIPKERVKVGGTYYQKVTKLGAAMRHMHNLVKSTLIYTIMNKEYSNRKLSVLDMGCGRGGDIEKFFYCTPSHVVGVDVSSHGIRNSLDGAEARYGRLKARKKGVPKMVFIQADCCMPLSAREQLGSIPHMSNANKASISREFAPGVEFDRINCQFCMHYFLASEASWSGFTGNVNRLLKDGGYLVGTCLDARSVVERMGGRDSISEYVSDEKGSKKKLFELVRGYPDGASEGVIGVGNAVKFYAAWMFEEDNYVTEYLVDINFIESELLKRANLELVDTLTFKEFFEMGKGFFAASEHESVSDTKKYLANATVFYDDSEISRKLRVFSDLNMFFVFRRRGVSCRKRGMVGGGEPVDIRVMPTLGGERSLLYAVHAALSDAGVIPENSDVSDIAEAAGVSMVDDIDVDKKYMKALSNIKIYHTVNDKEVVALNGVCILETAKDCNGYVDVEVHGDMTSKRIIIVERIGCSYRLIESDGKTMFSAEDHVVSLAINGGWKVDNDRDSSMTA